MSNSIRLLQSDNPYLYRESWRFTLSKKDTARVLGIQASSLLPPLTQTLVQFIDGYDPVTYEIYQSLGEEIIDEIIRAAGGKLIQQESYSISSQDPLYKEKEARIIRLIFEWYVTGDGNGPLSYYKIAKKLTKMKVLTRADKDPKFAKSKRGVGEWYAATIGYIISCETYAGVWYYGKKGKDKSEWIPVAVPAIIIREQWEAAQTLKKYKQEKAARNMRYNYLLSKRITCGCGNYKMAGFGSRSRGRLYTYYRCGGMSQGFKCGLPHFPSSKVDDIVWWWVEEVLRDPARLKNGLEQYQAEQEKQATPVQQELDIVEELLAQHNKDLVDAVASLKVVKTPRAKAAIAADIEHIEGVLDSLDAQKAELVKKLERNTLTTKDLVTINEWAATISADLGTIRQDFDSKRSLIELLDVQGRLAVEDEQKVIYVKAKFNINEERLLIVSQTTGSSRLQIVC